MNTAGKFARAPDRCVVTGSSGFVGRRLVEMLLERGAASVVAFDVVPPADDASKDPRIEVGRLAVCCCVVRLRSLTALCSTLLATFATPTR